MCGFGGFGSDLCDNGLEIVLDSLIDERIKDLALENRRSKAYL